MVHIIDEVFKQSREKDKASAMRKKMHSWNTKQCGWILKKKRKEKKKLWAKQAKQKNTQGMILFMF